MTTKDLAYETLQLTGTSAKEYSGMTMQEIENCLTDYCHETDAALSDIHERAKGIFDMASKFSAASILGSIKTPAKAAASRENGKRGGRPLQFSMIFDNGGGTTLQTRNYCHYYDDPKQAAHDVTMILFYSDNPSRDWDGNDPECRMEYDKDVERNGGYWWMERKAIEDTIKAGVVTPWGNNMSEFFAALGVKIED